MVMGKWLCTVCWEGYCMLYERVLGAILLDVRDAVDGYTSDTQV